MDWTQHRKLREKERKNKKLIIADNEHCHKGTGSLWWTCETADKCSSSSKFYYRTTL